MVSQLFRIPQLLDLCSGESESFVWFLVFTRAMELFSFACYSLPGHQELYVSQFAVMFTMFMCKTIKTAAKRGECIRFKFFTILFSNSTKCLSILLSSVGAILSIVLVSFTFENRLGQLLSFFLRCGNVSIFKFSVNFVSPVGLFCCSF